MQLKPYSPNDDSAIKKKGNVAWIRFFACLIKYVHACSEAGCLQRWTNGVESMHLLCRV